MGDSVKKLSPFAFLILCLGGFSYISWCQLKHPPAQPHNLGAAPSTGNIVAAGYNVDSGLQTQLATDPNGGLLFSSMPPDGGLRAGPVYGNLVAAGYNVDSGLPTQLATDPQGAIIVSALSPGFGPAFALGAACSMTATTSCAVSTDGGTASSQCFFSQNSGALATLPCECASSANTCTVTCGAAVTGTFTCMLVN
jgi:hypothetical protein